jgi:hypothetical protein
MFELLRRSIPHPSPPLIKGRGQESHFSRGNSPYHRVEDNQRQLSSSPWKGEVGWGMDLRTSSNNWCFRRNLGVIDSYAATATASAVAITAPLTLIELIIKRVTS